MRMGEGASYQGGEGDDEAHRDAVVVGGDDLGEDQEWRGKNVTWRGRSDFLWSLLMSPGATLC